jgi:hypothetical protein
MLLVLFCMAPEGRARYTALKGDFVLRVKASLARSGA